MSTGVWTDNWRGMKNAMLLGVYKSGLTSLRYTDGTVPGDCNKDSSYVCYSPMGWFYNGSTVGVWAQNSFQFGSGDTAPSAADWKMGEPLSLGFLSLVNESLSFDVEGGSATRVVKVAVSNPSDSQSVTVREWGVVTRHASGKWALTYHALLDEPVTLQPFQSATLTLTLSMTLSDPL